MLDALEPTCPALIKMVIPKCITIPKFTGVLKRLVRERISVKDMKSILETVAHYASVENDPGMLAEYARASLSRYIVYKYAIQDKHRHALPELLPVYLLDPHFEMMVQDSIQRSTVESYLALDPEISTQFLESCKSIMNPDANPNPIILTHREIRYFIWKLLETDFPNLTVLSYQELPPHLQIHPLGIIRGSSL
jgi:type III secretion protein V